MTSMKVEYRPVELANVGVLQIKVPQLIMAAIWAEVDHIQKNFDQHDKMNQYLAGNIEREYALTQCRNILEPFIMDVAQVYQSRHEVRKQDSTHATTTRLDGVWCNFQKATEFNPNHTHSGLLSFVIWVQVPYDIQEELSKSPGRASNKNNAGCFELIYNTTVGDLATTVFPADRSWEGQMLMFPAKMAHCVYPFYTSRDYRISVSGNIVVSQ